MSFPVPGTSTYPASATPTWAPEVEPDKSFMTAWLLAWFLGIVGADRFAVIGTVSSLMRLIP